MAPYVVPEPSLMIRNVDHDPPDWPKLLHLYSRLKPGVTVFEWMEEYEVQELGIDVRRFTSFGVVKVPFYFFLFLTISYRLRCHLSRFRDSFGGYTAGQSSSVRGIQ